MKTILSCLVVWWLMAGGISAQTVTDFDGHLYHAVTIGTQTWLVENLRTTHFRNGTPIPQVQDSMNWAASSNAPARCYYQNDSAANDSVYGALYNWKTMNDTNGLCPLGWHVSTHPDWTTLENYLGGGSVAGGKLKEAGIAHWTTPNTGADNSSGFTGLPGGMRGINHEFTARGENGLFWTSTQQSGTMAWSRYLYYLNAAVDVNPAPKYLGLSVRCVKDLNPGIPYHQPAGDLELWPNPAVDCIHISGQAEGHPLVRIRNTPGDLVLETRMDDTSAGIVIQHLAAGVYSIEILDGEVCRHGKFIKLQ
ncbi:MAG TPA: FISUMP domain-containing protein [Bacteroidales bacterium]|nr:FISUMP domain-containing protein [Bacteroidales bacterium]HRZ50203.1 FISUMP domain-containing protein [Bacteroidales bacterium]